MKKALIITLLCFNAALLVGLVLGTRSQRAEAQAFRGAANYLMITGHIGTNWDAVHVIDMGGRQIRSWRYDKTRKRLVPFTGRSLEADFRRATPTPERERRR